MVEVNSTNRTVTTGELIPLTTTVRRVCCDVVLGSNNVTFNKAGIYIVDATFNATASTAGNITVQLLLDDEVQSNGTASETAADTTGIHNLHFTTSILVPAYCKCVPRHTLTLKNVGTGATYELADLVVERKAGI